MMDIRNGLKTDIPEYQVWFREDRNSISPKGEQGFEDIGIMILIIYSHNGTKVVNPEMWDQTETRIQYLNNARAGPSNVGASSSHPPAAWLKITFRLCVIFIFILCHFSVFLVYSLFIVPFYLYLMSILFLFLKLEWSQLMAWISLS